VTYLFVVCNFTAVWWFICCLWFISTGC